MSTPVVRFWTTVADDRPILFLVGGFVMIEEEYRQREPVQIGTRHLWAEVDDETIDPVIRAAMTDPTNTDALFTYTLDRLLDAVLD